MRASGYLAWLCAAMTLCAAGCSRDQGGGLVNPTPGEGGPDERKMMTGGETLGADVKLIAVPSDDDTYVGKVHIPTLGGVEDERAFQPNPCLEHLELKSFAAQKTVRDVKKFSASGGGSALLNVIQIGAAVERITDYQYDFAVSKKMVANDTIAYAECCARRRGGCGDEFVREMYYGEGVYRLLTKTEVSAKAGLPLMFDASGKVAYEVLGERTFKGFFAYRVKPTPTTAPEAIDSRVGTIPTDGGPDLQLPKTLDGAALLEQSGKFVVITTKSDAQHSGNQLKAIGSARNKQRRALKNLLAGPPYNTPPAQLHDRVEDVYGRGEEVDAYQEAGVWYLKMRHTIR